MDMSLLLSVTGTLLGTRIPGVHMVGRHDAA